MILKRTYLVMRKWRNLRLLECKAELLEVASESRYSHLNGPLSHTLLMKLEAHLHFGNRMVWEVEEEVEVEVEEVLLSALTNSPGLFLLLI